MPRLYMAMIVACVNILVWSAANALAQSHWVGSWAAAQQVPEPRNALAVDDLPDATLRQIVHLSLGGPEVRLHLSNRFSHAPLHFSSVHIAKPVALDSPRIVADSDKAVTFSGRPDVTIPPGADYVSDPVAYPMAPLSDLTITLHLDQSPADQTGHPGSRATSYLVHGVQVSAADLPDAKKIEHWYFIAEVDVTAPPQAAAIVTLGDSITDGHGATTNGNDRWPDQFSKRLQGSESTREFAVLNMGIGGNRLLLDGLGPNALARLDHDVLAPPGVRYVIVLEGVNDLGTELRGDIPQAEHDAFVHAMLSAYEQIIIRAHARGIQVIGATMVPFAASFYHPGAKSEADRQAINEWIRAPGHFDAVVDFDQIIRDPEHPDRMLPKFDCGDGLHPSPAGYAAMAAAIPLSLFSTAASFSTAARFTAAASSPQMAITFDDLPEHGPLPPGETRVQIVTKILAALRDAHVPEVYGFVNGQRLDHQPANEGTLSAWREAGYPLGNHSWSHMNLNQNAAEAFENDIDRNEPVLTKWMKDKTEDWHWFRFPYLAEGDTTEKRGAIRDFLARHGYRVAGVTMSFGDYMWNEPYARCLANGDRQAIEGLESTYLKAADEEVARSRQLARALYGRDIPYVLLMHVGAFDAEMLPRLLKLYASRGFTFVTLPDAESDEFYRLDTNVELPYGPDSLEAAAAVRHVPLPVRTPYAQQLEAACR